MKSKTNLKYIKNHLFPFAGIVLLCAIFFSSLSAAKVLAAGCPPTPGDPHTKEVIGLSGTPECVLPDVANGNGPNIVGLIAQLVKILNAVIPFLVGLAVLFLIYGILGYIRSAADEEKRKEAKSVIVWGILGIFVMVSVWGFVNILVKTFNLNTSNSVVTDIYKPQTVPTAAPTTVIELINRTNAIGSYVIPFLISIAVFIVILGIVNYIRQGDNEEKRTEGRKFIIWGVISIFVMLSIWGFVNILVNSLGLKDANTVPNMTNILDNLKLP